MAEPPADRRYASSHEWAIKDGNLIVVGITAHAVQELSDLVFIDLPESGTAVTSGEPFGEIESVKAVSELNAPVTGRVVEINRELEDNLDILVESPYDHGWMIKIEPSDPSEYTSLLQQAEYQRILEEDDH